MNKLTRMTTWLLGLMLGLLGFGAVGMARTAAQTPDPTGVVSAFYAALSASDQAKALSLVDPDGTYVENPSLYEHKHSLRIFTNEVGNGKYHILINNNALRGVDTVVTDISVTGGDFASLPNPAHITTTATVRDGRITDLLTIFSDETLAGLGIIEQPGMPRTGDNTTIQAWIVAALATLAGTLGLLVRHAASRTQ